MCENGLNAPLHITDPDYNCRHIDDDLRTAICSNKNNETVIDVLKSEIECGWNFSSSLHNFGASVIVLMLLILKLV